MAPKSLKRLSSARGTSSASGPRMSSNAARVQGHSDGAAPSAVAPPVTKWIECARALYDDVDVAPCPFTDAELRELERTGEVLVFVPSKISANELCQRWAFKSNTDFDADRLIRYAMADEGHWFIASGARTPELIYKSAVSSKRQYEDDGLHGMDVRRYLAFAATHRRMLGSLPDQAYWTFLHSGSYDRSGISIIGFDSFGNLNHHGWMKDFKAKFVGSRYAVLAPRLEVNEHTSDLPRAYRGGGRKGREADMD